MNKLYVENDTITKQELDGSIKLITEEKNDLFMVNRLFIEVVEDTELWIDYHALEKTKLEVLVQVNPHVKFMLYEVRSGKKMKIKYQYHLDEYADVQIHKFYCAEQVREFDIVHLNGMGSSINQIVKSIATDEEKYDMAVYHNAKKTTSKIVNHGVTMHDGSIIFNVTSVVPQNMKECLVSQQSRIITNNQKECKISPNLLIDEYDVEANHSALIGKFQDEELFYLQSRGIPKEMAISLLTKGFLCSMITEENMRKIIEDKISEYWR